jgi:hypothetical protein
VNTILSYLTYIVEYCFELTLNLIWRRAQLNCTLTQNHVFLSSSHRSLHFYNNRHQNDWLLQPVISFQPLFKQPSTSYQCHQILPHINDFGCMLRTIPSYAINMYFIFTLLTSHFRQTLTWTLKYLTGTTSIHTTIVQRCLNRTQSF